MFDFSQGLVSDSGTWPLSQRDWPFHSPPRLVKLERGWVCRCLLHQSDGGWPGDHVPRLDFILQLWYQSFYSGGSEPPPFLNIEYHQQRSSHIQEPALSGPALNQDHRYLPYILHQLIIQHIHDFSSTLQAWVSPGLQGLSSIPQRRKVLRSTPTPAYLCGRGVKDRLRSGGKLGCAQSAPFPWLYQCGKEDLKNCAHSAWGSRIRNSTLPPGAEQEVWVHPEIRPLSLFS